MAIVKIKGVEHESLDLDTLTLGELRILKRHFDVTDMVKVNTNDPDFVAGVFYLILRRAHAEWEHKRLMNTVDSMTVAEMTEAETTEAEPADVAPKAPAKRVKAAGK